MSAHDMLKPKEYILDVPLYVPGAHQAAGALPPAILSANENALGCSLAAKAVLKNTINAIHRYPDGGSNALREAIADIYKLPPSQLIATAGSDELISLICRAYVGAGDEVLMSQYGFLMVEISAKLCGASVVKAPETDYHANIDAILDAVNERTKIVMLANPNNPTGSYLDRQALHRLHQALPKRVLLVIDGAYCEYVDAEDYDDGMDLVKTASNVIVTRTFSKIYGLASLRLGWGYADQTIIDVLNRVRPPFNVSAQAQAVGIAAVQDQGFIKRAKAHNLSERARVAKQLYQLGHNQGWILHPSVTNFIMLELGDKAQAAAVADHLMAQGIIVRPLQAYGLERHLRITIGTIDENDRLLAALKHYERADA